MGQEASVSSGNDRFDIFKRVGWSFKELLKSAMGEDIPRCRNGSF